MLTIDDIRSLNCCYDPTKYLDENWEGSVLDIVNMSKVPSRDRLWVVCREQFIGTYTLRLLEAISGKQAHTDPNIRACQLAYGYDSYTLIAVLRFILTEGAKNDN